VLVTVSIADIALWFVLHRPFRTRSPTLQRAPAWPARVCNQLAASNA
jgi:hypothetical protein